MKEFYLVCGIKEGHTVGSTSDLSVTRNLGQRIQETLTRRTLQLCSLQTDSVPNKDWNLKPPKLPSAMSFLEREASASVYQMQCSIVEGSTPNAHVVAQAENILAVASSAR